MNQQTKIIFLIMAGLVLAYLLYAGQGTQTNQLPSNAEAETQLDHFEPTINTATEHYTDDNVIVPPQSNLTQPEIAMLDKKFASKNRAMDGQYKRSSYNEGNRGDLGKSDWQNFYDHNNNIIGESQTGDNDVFLPNDEAGDGFAVFRTNKQESCGGNQDCPPEELFDVQKYLPQEVNDDWFELVPEAISVKNRHLINITKPIGVNTIGSSKKNASYDLRGAPSCPKFVVSPFLNSSIEPDNNLKPL